MDVRRKIYAILGCIYLGAFVVLASGESHEKFDAISSSDDQLMLIEASTQPLSGRAVSHSVGDNDIDTSGDSMPTMKQGQDTDLSAILSTKPQSNDFNSLYIASKKQDGIYKPSSSKQTRHHSIPTVNSSTKSQTNRTNMIVSMLQRTENIHLATHLSTRVPSHKGNIHKVSSDLPFKLQNHVHDADPSVTKMTSQLANVDSEQLTQRSTKRHAPNGDVDPSTQVSTKQLTLNDDPSSSSESTEEKKFSEPKAKGETDPVTMLSTKIKVDLLNDFTVKPNTEFIFDLHTTKSATGQKTQENRPISDSKVLPTPEDIRIKSSSEHTLSLSLASLPSGQMYRIEITSDQIANYREIFFTPLTEFQIVSLTPGTLYKFSVRIVTEKLEGEEIKFENYTVPLAPHLNISRIGNNFIEFAVKENGVICRNVHINEELRNHTRIHEDGEGCKMLLEKLCAGRKYSMSAWQTRDVWKSQPTKITFVTKQKRKFDYKVHLNILRITWEELRESGCPIVGYKVHMNGSGNAVEKIHRIPEYITVVREGSTYIFRIQTVYENGIGELSDALVISVNNTLPGAVKNFTILNRSATNVQIFLQPPVETNGNILGYLIRTTADKFCQTKVINCTGCKGPNMENNPSFALPEVCRKKLCGNITMNEVENMNREFTIENLLPFHRYKMAVTAYNKEGCGNETQRFFTTFESIPTPVENLNITKVTNTTLEFRWERPCFPNGNITKYKVEYVRGSELEDSYQTHNMAGKLEKLHPYMMYTIKVSACTRLGCSKSQSVTTRTHIGIPINVKNVQANPLSSTSVIVSWDQPQDKMGPTNYSVDTLDNGEILQGCQVEGFQTTQCTVTGLDEYWPYIFKVTAYTMAGHSLPMGSPKVRTLESTPGRVRDLQIEFKCFTRIIVKWEPPILRELNGIIHKYSISLLEQDGLNKTQIVNKTHRYQEFTVKPEHNFTIQVRAVTRIGEGLITEETITIPAGPPVIPEGILFSPASFFAKDRSKQISILLPMKFFLNDTNGKPNMWGLIVAQSDAVTGNNTAVQMTRSEFHPKSMRRWQNVHDDDIIKAYRVTADDWKPPSFYGDDANSHYILGADEECDMGQYYCNGYLRPGRSYRVKAFMCTRGGCSETRYSGLFYTEKDLSPAYISTPILICIAVISMAAVFFMWRKQLFCFRKRPMAILSEVSSIHKTGETNRSFNMNLESKSRRIMLDEFHDRVERMKKDSHLLFCEEFQLLRTYSPSKSHLAAELQANRTKNRYTNILAFDHSRVKLLPLDDEEGSDYINANYMPGYQSKREYIAAQGPLPGTKDDFWRMIWEQNVSVVVMVTQAVERGRIKSEIYWPTGTDPVYFGDLVVQLRSESNLSDYILRILDVQLGEQKREVKHFHFLKWPDFGCPANTSLLINFILTVRSYMPYTATGPTIIHCSAGVGRTGTFIAIDWLLQHIREHQDVDIFNLILEMRNYRVNMVQTEDQYIFIHQCIADHLRQVEGGSAEEDVFMNDTQM